MSWEYVSSRGYDRKGVLRTFDHVRNTETDLCYRDVPLYEIAIKGALLFLFLAPYIALYMVVNLARIPYTFFVSSQEVQDTLFSIVKAPIYWMALEGAALYMIVRPLEGRALFADLERELHGKSVNDDVRYKEGARSVLYAGLCMQPEGTGSNFNLVPSRKQGVVPPVGILQEALSCLQPQLSRA